MLSAGLQNGKSADEFALYFNQVIECVSNEDEVMPLEHYYLQLYRLLQLIHHMDIHVPNVYKFDHESRKGFPWVLYG